MWHIMIWKQQIWEVNIEQQMELILKLQLMLVEDLILGMVELGNGWNTQLYSVGFCWTP